MLKIADQEIERRFIKDSESIQHGGRSGSANFRGPRRALKACCASTPMWGSDTNDDGTAQTISMPNGRSDKG